MAQPAVNVNTTPIGSSATEGMATRTSTRSVAAAGGTGGDNAAAGAGKIDGPFGQGGPLNMLSGKRRRMRSGGAAAKTMGSMGQYKDPAAAAAAGSLTAAYAPGTKKTRSKKGAGAGGAATTGNKQQVGVANGGKGGKGGNSKNKKGGNGDDENCAKSSSAIPIFLKKTYKMIETCDPAIASWTPDGEMFVIKDPDLFASTIIPQYFDHNKFSSFARQLNFYGFRKMQSKPIRNDEYDQDTAKHVTFYNEKFKRGRCDLLKEIQRSTRSGASTSNADHAKEVGELKKRIAELEGRMTSMERQFDERVQRMELEMKAKVEQAMLEMMQRQLQAQAQLRVQQQRSQAHMAAQAAAAGGGAGPGGIPNGPAGAAAGARGAATGGPPAVDDECERAAAIGTPAACEALEKARAEAAANARAANDSKWDPLPISKGRQMSVLTKPNANISGISRDISEISGTGSSSGGGAAPNSKPGGSSSAGGGGGGGPTLPPHPKQKTLAKLPLSGVPGLPSRVSSTGGQPPTRDVSTASAILLRNSWEDKFFTTLMLGDSGAADGTTGAAAQQQQAVQAQGGGGTPVGDTSISSGPISDEAMAAAIAAASEAQRQQQNLSNGGGGGGGGLQRNTTDTSLLLEAAGDLVDFPPTPVRDAIKAGDDKQTLKIQRESTAQVLLDAAGLSPSNSSASLSTVSD